MASRNQISFWMFVMAAVALPSVALAQFPQGFNTGAGGIPANWVSLNNSPGGAGVVPDWNEQTGDGTFPPHTGAGFIAVNYNSSTGTNPISNYLMSPVVNLENGAIIKFWTRTIEDSAFPDRLILTYSTNGASTTPTDFANIANVNFHKLVDINPTLSLGGYPETWTQFTATLSGLPAGVTPGRFAFWYFVQTSAGPQGVNSNYIGVDDAHFIPPGATTGACCDAAGNCSQQTPAACTGPGNVFSELAADCEAISCVGKCCQPDGFCAQLTPTACSGAGFIFSGLGSVCNPLALDECLGRCCMPDGSCIADGPTPCANSGGTFGGVGVGCGDGTICRGRCCVGNTCIADQSPNQCAAAPGGPGVLTYGASCEATSDFTSTTAVAIPDGVAGGGLGAQATSIQNVAGVTGNITDLNLEVQINHTFVGDLVVAIEHLGASVTVIDLMGHAALDCGGCAEPNINVTLDDEGTGGAIEDQCVAGGPAAQSPPNFTPNSSLSAFDGMNPNGAWTIKVQDGCGVDVGTLVRWSLKFASATSPCAPSCTCKGDLNGSGTVNGADVNKFAQCVASGGGAGCACADINGGGITAADVTPFVNALIAGTACIP